MPVANVVPLSSRPLFVLTTSLAFPSPGHQPTMPGPREEKFSSYLAPATVGRVRVICPLARARNLLPSYARLGSARTTTWFDSTVQPSTTCPGEYTRAVASSKLLG